MIANGMQNRNVNINIPARKSINTILESAA